jgi:hypothetical protein
MMLKATHSKHAPWRVVRSDDKKQARLDCISHILKSIPFNRVKHERVKLPKRGNKGRYDDQAVLRKMGFGSEQGAKSE